MIATVARITEVTVKMAARELNVSHDTVARLCEAGALRARRISERGWWRIEYDSVVEYKASLLPRKRGAR